MTDVPPNLLTVRKSAQETGKTDNIEILFYKAFITLQEKNSPLILLGKQVLQWQHLRRLDSPFLSP